MPRFIARLKLPAACLLACVLGTVLVAQTWPHGRALAQAGTKEEDEWTWPKTLQVYPSQPGDPVKLVKVTKEGEELVPGKYELPQLAGDGVDPVKDWLSDVSFTLKSQASRDIAAVSIAVLLPSCDTHLESEAIAGCKSPRELWCGVHPHWCDEGCPGLVLSTLHWGLIPAQGASGLRSRYEAEAKVLYGYRAGRTVVEGKELLRVGPGEEATLSGTGRVYGMFVITDLRHGFSDVMNGIVYNEWIEEAQDTEPCSERAKSKTGCAFAEVSKFNIGIDVVYFDGGTIWGNYGYGYAIPNPDGIFTRVDAPDFPRMVRPASPSN